MKLMLYSIFACILCCFFTTAWSQNPEPFRLSHRVKVAPPSVFEKFRSAGMQPGQHVLTDAEQSKLDQAFDLLPPVHKKILERHLHSVSFMDNMPNTALTSPVETDGSVKMFHITFRAGILDETISEWATAKEMACYDFSGDSGLEIVVDAGNLDAIVYVLLHEATHVVDAVKNITPHPDDRDALVAPTEFTRGVWHKMNLPDEVFIDRLLESTRFRGGQPIPVKSAAAVYQALQRTPFVSLYAMAAWFEDLAEITAIHHLTKKLGQPYAVVVKHGDAELFRFEPMRSERVMKRLEILGEFYL